MAISRILWCWLAVAAVPVATVVRAGQQIRGDGASPARPAPTEEQLDLGRHLVCPQGLERGLPGIYYYCVGARDLASGRSAHGLSMLEIAAAWGSKPAQYTLGIAYFNGDVVPPNRSLGLAWLGLAAERRDPYYVATLRSALEHATAAERTDAELLWKRMSRKYGDARAAVRAHRRYRYERVQILADEPYGAHWCVAGLNGRSIDARRSGADASALCETGARWVSRLDRYADSLFQDWQGHVTVGPLQQVAPPAGPGR